MATNPLGIGGTQNGAYPFAVELRDLGAATWSTFTAADGDEWWLASGVLHVIHRNPQGVVSQHRHYPEHAWYGLRYA